MMILGIDPGASGGIAIDDGNTYRCLPMPKTEGDVVALIRELNSNPNAERKVAYMEKLVLHMGPGIPASTMAVYAGSYYFIMGCLMTLGWRIEIVTPQNWQKALGLGITGRQKANTMAMTAQEAAAEKKRIKLVNARLKAEWKRKLKSRAQQLFPDCAATLDTADALLILRYAQLREAGAIGTAKRDIEPGEVVEIKLTPLGMKSEAMDFSLMEDHGTYRPKGSGEIPTRVPNLVSGVQAPNPEQGRCSKCHRCTWSKEELGQRCGMTQPNGSKCTGVFVPPDAV